MHSDLFTTLIEDAAGAFDGYDFELSVMTKAGVKLPRAAWTPIHVNDAEAPSGLLLVPKGGPSYYFDIEAIEGFIVHVD